MKTPRPSSSALRWVLVAGVLHVIMTLTVFLIGHYQVAPNVFDGNGTGVAFAMDAAVYQRLASESATILNRDGLTAWLNTPLPLHCRLYSLLFASLGRVVGQNVIAAEPLNLFFYLSILWVIFLMGRELFGSREGFLAAAVVSVWPSFLIHTSQLLRDPASILCMLAFLLVLVILVGRDLTALQSFGLGIVGASLVTLLWLVRGNFWGIVFASLVIATILLALSMIASRKLLLGNVCTLVFVFLIALLIPSRLESTTLPGTRPPVTPFSIPSSSRPTPAKGFWTRVLNQVTKPREGFHKYSGQGSSIDGDVQLTSVADILRYLPRAAEIGFLAPFPNMWFQSGTNGIAARIVSGLETVVMYVFYVAALFCVVQQRRNLKMWLLLLVAITGLLGLGLVVANVGALYRLRYMFWIIVIIISTHGLLMMYHRSTRT